MDTLSKTAIMQNDYAQQLQLSVCSILVTQQSANLLLSSSSALTSDLRDIELIVREARLYIQTVNDGPRYKSVALDRLAKAFDAIFDAERLTDKNKTATK